MAHRANPASQAKQSNPERDSSKQTFLEHLYELRKRLFWVVLTLVFTTAIGLEIKDQLIAVVMAPLKGGKLIYLTPGGGFSFIFTLSFYFGILLTIPIITFQIYRFLQPMLEDTSQKFIIAFMGISSVLAAGGAALAYFLAIPGALGFLNGVAGSSIVPNLTADSYLTFVVTYVVGMAALFQLPLLIFLFDHIRPIPPGVLTKSQRYGIVVTTILAGLITPSPDLLNYSIVLFPMLGAFELGVFAVYVRRKFFRNRVKAAKQPRVSKTVPEAEPLLDEAPLTAIMEEMAEENGDRPQEVAIAPVTMEPLTLPALEPIVVVPQTVVGAPGVFAEQPQAAPVQYVQQPVQQAVPQPAPVQPVTVVAPAPTRSQLTPQTTRGRSIDGMRAPARYRTNVHIPVRPQARPVAPQTGEESADGLLTA